MIKVINYNHVTLEVVNENDEITFKTSNQFEDLGGFDDDFFVVINENMIELLDEKGFDNFYEEGKQRIILCLQWICILASWKRAGEIQPKFDFA